MRNVQMYGKIFQIILQYLIDTFQRRMIIHLPSRELVSTSQKCLFYLSLI